MIHTLAAAFLDISVHPDFEGFPSGIQSGLVHLGNAAAALVMLLAGIGIAVSVVGILAGSWTSNPHALERSKHGLLVSAGSVALLYIAVAAGNFVTGLFR